jgi:hypothetical protein
MHDAKWRATMTPCQPPDGIPPPLNPTAANTGTASPAVPMPPEAQSVWLVSRSPWSVPPTTGCEGPQSVPFARRLSHRGHARLSATYPGGTTWAASLCARGVAARRRTRWICTSGGCYRCDEVTIVGELQPILNRVAPAQGRCTHELERARNLAQVRHTLVGLASSRSLS